MIDLIYDFFSLINCINTLKQLLFAKRLFSSFCLIYCCRTWCWSRNLFTSGQNRPAEISLWNRM